VADKKKLINEICNSLINIDEDIFKNNVKKALDLHIDPAVIIDEGIIRALRTVGEKFESGEFFLADLVGAAEPAQKVMKELLEPELKKKSDRTKSKGKIVLGTVQGDIHSIGKNIVAAMLFAAGFEVINLGENVPAKVFVNKAKEIKADIVAASALLTTTLPGQRQIVETLQAEGLRSQAKTMFGGAPCTAEWVEEIGGDGYAENAIEAVRVAHRLLGLKEKGMEK